MTPTLGHGQTLADVAVELSISTNGLGEVAFATLLESMVAVECRKRLEELAARIGLSEDATCLVLNEADQRAALIARAHKIIKALIPYEGDTVLARMLSPEVANDRT